MEGRHYAKNFIVSSNEERTELPVESEAEFIEILRNEFMIMQHHRKKVDKRYYIV